MSETPTPVHATVPEQPESSMPLRKKQPLLILLFIILLIFVGSSVVTATKKAGPLKSQLTGEAGNGESATGELLRSAAGAGCEERPGGAAATSGYGSSARLAPRSEHPWARVSECTANDAGATGSTLWSRQSVCPADDVADVGAPG